MNVKRSFPRFLLSALIVVNLPALVLQAQEATTVPVGAITVAISPSAGATAKLTYFSAPLLGPSNATGQLSGKISGVTSNAITNSSGGWTASGLSAAASPHFIRIISGSAAGHSFRITANTADTVTLDTEGLVLTNLGIAAGDSYEIFAGDTILSLFGTPSVDNPIQGGTSAQTADNIMLYSGSAWIPYYFNTDTNTWRSGASPTNRGNTVVKPDQAILYSRLGTSALQFTFTGSVPTVARRTVVSKTGLSTVASFFAADQTLFNLKVHEIPGWKKVGDVGIDSTSADKIMVHNGTAWIPYFYNATAGQWRSGASPTNRNAVVVPAGSAILLSRSGSAGTDVYSVTAPYSF